MSSRFNPEDSAEEHLSDDVEDTEPSEQTPGDDSDDTEQFTNVTLDDIDRESLSPEMKSAYDTLSTRRNAMQNGFTQKTQVISALKDDAERWKAIESDPLLARALNEAIYRRDNGLATSDVDTEPIPELPDANDDPEGYLRGVVAGELKKVLGTLIPELKSEIGTVSNYVRGQQANLEFNNLVIKYPAAATIGVARLDSIRNQYSGNGGNVMSLEKALHLAATDEPSLLVRGDSSPSGKKSSKSVLRVEKPSGNKTSRDRSELPDGIRDLRKRAEESRVSGKSIGTIARETLDKLRVKGETI